MYENANCWVSQVFLAETFTVVLQVSLPVRQETVNGAEEYLR